MKRIIPVVDVTDRQRRDDHRNHLDPLDRHARQSRLRDAQRQCIERPCETQFSADRNAHSAGHQRDSAPARPAQAAQQPELDAGQLLIVGQKDKVTQASTSQRVDGNASQQHQPDAGRLHRTALPTI